MRPLFFFLISTVLLWGTHHEAKIGKLDKAEHVLIKVLMKENIDGALIDIDGGFKIYNPQNDKLLTSSSKGKRYYLQTNASGLKWGESYPSVHQMRIVPNAYDGMILVDGIQYKGSLEVYDVNSKIQLVGEVDVEDLLKSTLSSGLCHKEYSSSTIEAIAIAMRTHFYYSASRGANPYWDVHANEIGYSGYGLIKINPAIERAVAATRHLILTYKDKPFATSWTENSGGKTASYESIYRKKATGPDGVAVPYAQKERSQNRWKCSLSHQDLAGILRLATIQTIDLFQDPSTKKIYALRITDGQKFKELTYFEFQTLLGKNRILSTDFTVSLLKDQIVFDGYGKGNGVGICLFSAEQLARFGYTAPQILQEFYPETFLVKLDNIPESFKKD